MDDWVVSAAEWAWPIVVLVIFGVGIILRRRGSDTMASDGPADTPYRIYTTWFDRQLAASEVPAQLPLASPDAAKGWYQKDEAAWPESVAHGDALLGVECSSDTEAIQSLVSAIGPIDPRDIIVAFLIDQSGSMSGERMAWASVFAERVSKWLDSFGAHCEILGFTTAAGMAAMPERNGGMRESRSGQVDCARSCTSSTRPLTSRPCPMPRGESCSTPHSYVRMSMASR